MKRLILGLVVSLLLTTQTYAGFFTSFAASAIANNMSKGGIPSSRLKKINTYLWDMHERRKYDKGYKYYLKYLEIHTEDIAYLDTVANVYLDNNNKKKALEIYKKRILPWIVLEDRERQKKYKGYYNKIKNHR